ncbi:6-hydroxymethylpterin diphosphokinase MptE-like protein [Vibrio atlanticus]|uniref:6-hydroxymethylpterin diphosphokinase MptE-like domain-containing protein n=1 Tax=Vibrio atlanticus (strain LGP32) TaxID=575788 RepID=B7VHP1_VIBA3|nr:6-hydroxymethylpterin diphosphokinase MptE-like protein [Vibrio atlanticus]CAV17253.1 Conserved hypothetical protein [Vibrio atlanticus]
MQYIKYKLSNFKSFLLRFLFNLNMYFRKLLRYHFKYNKIKNLKNQHTNKRCFIIGNGPSLTKEILISLKKEKTFGVNAICKWFPELGFETTYYGIQDIRAFNALKEDILKISKSKMLMTSKISRKYGNEDRTYVFPLNYLNHNTYHDDFGSKVSKDVEQVVYDGYSINYSMIQIAMYMGFTEIYLIGMDCNYNFEDVENQYSVNHFIAQENPSLAGYKMIQALKAIKHEIDKENGIKIFDCSINGKLDLFPKQELEDILNNDK